MITKTDLIERVATQHELHKTKATMIVDSILHEVEAGLAAGAEVRLHGFGTFSVTERKAGTGRNPRTGETIQIAAKRGVKFKAASALNTAVAE